MQKICINCMHEKNYSGPCHICGFNESAYQIQPHHLPPGTLLAGKYMIGKVLGEGGFGITYIGIDLNLNIRIAIKEYFPTGCVTRNSTVSNTLSVFTGDPLDTFNKGKEKCIEEARTIARFNDADGIVSVKDFFLENGTSYIVMEFLEGETLSEFLIRNGGSMDAENALNIIKPVITSLSQLHKAGLIHRDISPDNIMLTRNGRVKLIDFGAARDVSSDTEKSLSIQLKRGYAPEEQYRTHGKQGPWTDVYALCATVYRMITGQIPEESLDRLSEDNLQAPSQLGINIRSSLEAVLMRGLAVSYQNRIQDMDELYKALYTDNYYDDYTPPPYNPKTHQQTNKNTKNFAAVTALSSVAALAAIIVIVIVANKIYSNRVNFDDIKVNSRETAVPATVSAAPATSVPTEIPITRTVLYNSQYTYKRMDDIHNSLSASNEKFLEVKNVMLDFNEKCVTYMNYGDNEVLKYLPVGTTAYTQQTEYKNKHSNIFEVLNNVEVYDVRVSGNTYYAWVQENMTVTENGITTNTTDRWIYKLTEKANSYAIIDYTRDPAS